jgi:hypothetical protein
MKTKYLDTKNCKALLPKHVGIPVERQLDDYLVNINSGGSGHPGLVEKLIQHNEKTIGQSIRLYEMDNAPDLCFIVRLSNEIKVGIESWTLDQPLNKIVKFHLGFDYASGVHWKIILPLQYLLKGWGDANKDYQCYIHVISENHKPQTVSMNRMTGETFFQPDRHNINEFYYIGITGRNWLQRLGEHMREMRHGSNKQFHQKWREKLGLENVLYTSTLMHVNLSKDKAMDWEEGMVDYHETVSGPHGLNMIPGGYKGLRELHKLGIIKTNERFISGA